jgi:hypothetical protein
MEAVAVIGLLGSIVQFVDVGTKLISAVKEIRQSASGLTREHEKTLEATRDLRSLSTRLEPSSIKDLTEDGKALRRLAQDCQDLSDELIQLIESLLPVNPRSTFQAVKATFSSLKLSARRKQLEERLQACQAQLQLHYNRLSW